MIKINLRQILWDKEITAAEIHRATGISSSMLSEIIHDKRINIGLDIVDKLCLYLKCDINDLITFTPIKNPQMKTKRKSLKKQKIKNK